MKSLFVEVRMCVGVNPGQKYDGDGHHISENLFVTKRRRSYETHGIHPIREKIQARHLKSQF